ncbi:hypothetical protein ABI59_16760 [Acidobacteria bacterium Mor1]|nr:hypothetical protein ABI59_16760 [Acidobacteria bacterium Mor1]
MEKDDSIKHLLQWLRLDERGWVLADHWDADLGATGIAHRDHPRRLVYVSSFQNDFGRYYYECEVPAGDEPTDYKVTATGENLSREELLAVLERHLTPKPGESAEEKQQ